LLKFIERKVYNSVKNNLLLKNIIRDTYQYLFSKLPGKRIYSDLEVYEREGSFFGFHDKNPWSKDNKKLLGHSFTSLGPDAWRKGKSIDLCLFKGVNWLKKEIVTSTKAWNWQQGSQVQWLNNEQFIYNDFIEGACRAIIFNLNKREKRILEHPIAAIDKINDRYASICFKTFGEAMDGYGYGFEANNARSTIKQCSIMINGINDKVKKEISINDLDSQIAYKSSNDKIDFISHCLFSPDGKKLLFLRRQASKNQRLLSEMFYYDFVKSKVFRLPFDNMVSHFTWVNNDYLLAYANKESEDGYYYVSLEDGTVKNVTENLYHSDGHPQATPDGKKIVFDTYPDRRRYQHLFVWDKQADDKKKLGKFYSPLKFKNDYRVDLHPRIRTDGKYICFDASYSGVRSLVTAKLPNT